MAADGDVEIIEVTDFEDMTLLRAAVREKVANGFRTARGHLTLHRNGELVTTAGFWTLSRAEDPTAKRIDAQTDRMLNVME